MAALRTPETGCPWDVEQDFKSIAPYTLEEAYEVADAIDREDLDDLREELGDLLLQVVYHARMAEEEDAFDFADVVEAITTKMIRRHPHVFGSEEVRSAGMAKGMWEKIKAQERAEQAERRATAGLPPKTRDGLLDTIPTGHPAVAQSLKLQQKAAKVGFDWGDYAPVRDKVGEELAELDQAVQGGDAEKIEDELGDVLFALVNLARHKNIDPETALRKSNLKFRTRFGYIEQQLKAQNRTLDEADLDEMEGLWQAAKSAKLR